MEHTLMDRMLMAVDPDRLNYVREKLIEYGAPSQLVKDVDEVEEAATGVIIDLDEIESCGDCSVFDDVLKQILQEEENHD